MIFSRSTAAFSAFGSFISLVAREPFLLALDRRGHWGFGQIKLMGRKAQDLGAIDVAEQANRFCMDTYTNELILRSRLSMTDGTINFRIYG